MRSTLVTEESSSLFNQEALAGKVVQIPRGKLSLVEIALAAESAGAVGLVVMSDEDDPDAVSCVDDDSSLSDPSARVVKLVWADLHHASSSIDDETGRVAETLPDAAREAGIIAGTVLVGAACSRLGTPVTWPSPQRDVPGLPRSRRRGRGFQRVLVSSGLLQSEEDFEESIEEIMDTLEFELHFRPAIGIPVVMVSRSVGVRTVELDPGTAVVLGGRRAPRVRRSCLRGESCPRQVWMGRSYRKDLQHRASRLSRSRRRKATTIISSSKRRQKAGAYVGRSSSARRAVRGHGATRASGSRRARTRSTGVRTSALV